jgi:DNA-binding XRE family transcriptional regulator
VSASAKLTLSATEARGFHKKIADALEATPDMVTTARELVRASCPDPALAQRWREILDLPIDELRAAITVETPEADQLRRFSPLMTSALIAGVVRLRPNNASPDRTKAESKLAQARLAAGFTQEEMATRTSIPPSTYWRLERGRIANPPAGYIVACARALGVPIEDLIEEDWLPRTTPRPSRDQ